MSICILEAEIVLGVLYRKGWPPKRPRKFIWRSFLEQHLLGFWPHATGSRQKFPQRCRKSSCQRGVVLVFLDLGWGRGPLRNFCLQNLVVDPPPENGLNKQNNSAKSAEKPQIALVQGVGVVGKPSTFRGATIQTQIYTCGFVFLVKLFFEMLAVTVTASIFWRINDCSIQFEQV